MYKLIIHLSFSDTSMSHMYDTKKVWHTRISKVKKAQKGVPHSFELKRVCNTRMTHLY